MTGATGSGLEEPRGWLHGRERSGGGRRWSEEAPAKKENVFYLGGTYSRLANNPKRSPAPLFHCATKAMRQEMWDAYAWFVGAFHQAAEKLKLGDRAAAFPPGCFPPALPFVPA